MNKESLEKFDNLNRRVIQRENDPVVERDGNIISAYELNQILKNAMTKYNEVLIKESNKLRNKMNIQSLANRLFKGSIPMIHSICPGVSEKGEKYIRVIFTDADKRYKGDAIISSNYQVYYNLLLPEYSEEDTTELLLSNPIKYFGIFSTLINFSNEYEGVNCEWNSNYELMNYEYTDDLFSVHYGLEDKNLPSLSFADVNDCRTSRDVEHPTKGTIDEYITEPSRQDKFLKRISVDINDLNELYKSLVEKELNKTKNPTMKRVK